MGQPSTRLQRITLFVVTGLMLLLCPALYFYTRAEGVFHLRDDMMIVLRVARVFWEHGVPYVNPGEAVAANTSLFWPILLSPAIGLIEDPLLAVRSVAMTSVVAWIAMAAWVASRQQTALQTVLCLLILCLSTPALRYGGSAWEHVPQTLVIAIASLLLFSESRATLQRRLLILYLLAASFVFRPDSVPLVGIFFLASFWQLGSERWQFLLGALPAAMLPIAYLAGMLWFYDDIVPNTYYLKVATTAENITSGIGYILSPYQSGPVPAFWLITALMWRRLSTAERVFMAMALVQILSVIYLGGDYFRAGRLLLVLLPGLTFLLVKHAPGVVGRVPVAVATSILILGPLVEPRGLQLDFKRHLSIASQVRLMHVARHHLVPEDGPVGLHHLGMSYWLPGFDVVDFLGKADPVIAHGPARNRLIGHNKWDYAHSFKAPITVVPFVHGAIERVQGNPTPRIRNWDWGIAATKALMAQPGFIYLAPEHFCFETTFGLFVRDDLAARFAPPPGQSCLPLPDTR